MKTLLIALLGACSCSATIQPNALWRVFPSQGASTNGGGWDPSVTSPGTDYSVNQNKNAAACTLCGSSTVDLSTTDAVAVGTTTITSATANFSAAIVGNGVYFTGGTGSITAVRRTVTARASTTSITIDTAIAASTGMTMNIGGALDTIATALTANVGGNAICVKSTGTISETANLVLNQNQSPINFNRLWGYATTCGDHGPVVVQLSTNTGLTAIQGTSAAGWWIDGFDVDCNSLGTSTGVSFASQSSITHTRIKNCTTQLLTGANYTTAMYNEFTACTSACTNGVFTGASSTFKFNYIHHIAAHCVDASSSVIFTDNIIDSCTGANHDGIRDLDLNVVFDRNVVYNVTRDCVVDTGSTGHILLGTSIQNNILSTCGAYGLNGAGVAMSAGFNFDGNAYFACTTANRKNIDQANFGAGYVNSFDQTLSADPFTNAAGGDFTPNSTVGGGAAVKAVGQPGFVGPSWNKATGTGYMDLGAFQTQYGTGGAGGGANFGVVQ